jgi:hypothetical protein
VLGEQLELDIDGEDIHELVDLKAEKPSNEIELEKQRSKAVEAEEVIPKTPGKLIAKKLKKLKAFAMLNSDL